LGRYDLSLSQQSQYLLEENRIWQNYRIWNSRGLLSFGYRGILPRG